MSGFNTHEGRMARRVVDCFTTDALRQIQSAVNGDEYVNEYRGGMGSDIRYLSDFALEQIKGAVGNGGGGGGDTYVSEIKSVYYYTEEDVLEKQTITKIQYDGDEYDGFYVDIRSNATYFSIILSEKENIEVDEENIVSLEDIEDVNLLIDIDDADCLFTYEKHIFSVSVSKSTQMFYFIVKDKNNEIIFVVGIYYRDSL